MRRPVAVPVLLVFLISGCAAGHGDVGLRAPASSPSSATVAHHSKSPRVPLALPEKPDFLLPVTHGTDSRPLPVFTPVEEVYTIHALCTGRGAMTIQYGPKDSDPSKITCDEPVTIGRVHTAPGEQKHLSVQVDGTDVHWSMAILSGAHAM